MVDQETTTYRQIALEEAKPSILDLRLAKALEAAKAFCEQRKIYLRRYRVATFEIADISTAKVESYDHLGKVHRLLLTLSGNNATLAEFSFITIGTR